MYTEEQIKALLVKAVQYQRQKDQETDGFVREFLARIVCHIQVQLLGGFPLHVLDSPFCADTVFVDWIRLDDPLSTLDEIARYMYTLQFQ